MSKLNETLTHLAEIIAWQGEEDHLAACDRLDAAEKSLRAVAPDVLKAAKERVKKWRRENEIE